MKKFTLVLATVIILTACGNSKWQRQDDSNITEEFKQRATELLNEQLAVLETDENNIEANFEAAYQYQSLGDYKKAVKYYKKVLELDEVHIVALNNIADIYEEVGEYELAAEYIKKLYPLMPDNLEAIKDTVRILLLAGDDVHAQEALDNFARLKRENNESDAGITQLVSSLKQQIEDYQQN